MRPARTIRGVPAFLLRLRMKSALPAANAEIASLQRLVIRVADTSAELLLVMQAAVIDGHLQSPEKGMQWIVNTLSGPGLLPDLDEARNVGGAQAWFCAEKAIQEEFRRAHPAPTLADDPAPSV